MMSIQLRTATPKDRAEIAELIYASTNAWYQLRGMTQIFAGGPETTEVFSEVYDVLEPGCCVVAENSRTGRLMGSCFYHPRPQHVSLGIMNVHPNYFGRGVARALLDYIIDYTDRHGYKALRLTQSALNLDSFSLYNSAGFVPRCAYQDMMLQVPEAGLNASLPGLEHVREATPGDVSALVELELSVSGISRETDYRFCIKNGQGFWHVSVYEISAGKIEGFLISSGHPAFNMLGPGVARTEAQAAALIYKELDQYRGRSPVTLVPMEKTALVRQMYEWGARNVELHFCQVRGEFQAFAGVNLPTFFPETG